MIPLLPLSCLAYLQPAALCKRPMVECEQLDFKHSIAVLAVSCCSEPAAHTCGTLHGCCVLGRAGACKPEHQHCCQHCGACKRHREPGPQPHLLQSSCIHNLPLGGSHHALEPHLIHPGDGTSHSLDASAQTHPEIGITRVSFLGMILLFHEQCRHRQPAVCTCQPV